MKKIMIGFVGAAIVAGCCCECAKKKAVRVEALDSSAWAASEWISAVDAPVFEGKVGWEERAASGTSWFARTVANEKKLVKATWMTAGLGVYEIYVNGTAVGSDFLKPGYTHYAKTKCAFTYDVTALMKSGVGESNTLAAEVSAGWWRDKILTPQNNVGFLGRKGAFRGVLKLEFADGTTELVGTTAKDWKAGTAGAVKHAAIFDGEEYDARVAQPVDGEGLGAAEVNTEFKGEIVPTVGAEVVMRDDLALKPVEAYCWSERKGSNCEWTEPEVNIKRNDGRIFGTVVKSRSYSAGEKMRVAPGENLVIDFGQNCAAVPRFRFRAASGTVLTALPGEMLNDGNGETARGNDGPAGSVYRENLRVPREGMRVVYTFAGNGVETYHPRFTFFGYRYLTISATAEVEIEQVESVPVTSITKEMELGKIETGEKDVNRLIANVYWGQLSNYLSVPTDCPQRNERLGWTADTQVFTEAGSFNADTSRFFHKWMRDMVDSRDAAGGFPSVAPFAQYGNEKFNLGWADAGVIVPYQVWKQFGDTAIIKENFEAMAKFVRKLDETKYKYADKQYTYADWLSFETFESCGNQFGGWGRWGKDPDALNYREYLAACYWLYDSRLMVRMAEAIGKTEEADFFRGCEKRAMDYIRATYIEADGLLLKPMRHLQTACIFALYFDIVEGGAREATKALLLKSIKEHGDCLQTGFLGTGFIMDTLSAVGAADVAYTLLLQHKNPSWLYSVDQGATTIWERWNSYTKKDGFGPVSMNSFNHYAYGAVLAWIYKTAAGIAADPSAPGFKRIIMKPVPDRRLGHVTAEYKSAAGLIKSAWKYEGDKWVWTFTVPAGATASVSLPGETAAKEYTTGTYTITR